MSDVRLITLDPGHFHAALVQKEMYPGVDPRVHVYAPLGGDLLAHLGRVTGFNTRKESPTAWELEVHAGPDYLPRLLAERPGNVVVLAGRNRVKIDYILAALGAGLHVLADKPWIIDPSDLPKLQTALDLAETHSLTAYDIMTERHEITSILQREIINDEATFGTALPGTADEPGVFMESVHYLLKTVAGVPLRRPPWFFDVKQQGEGLSDVGTHLVDLVPWMLFPGQGIDHERDLRLLAGERWPTPLTREQFGQITGEDLTEERLDYYCNTRVLYAVRGVHVRLDVLWDLQAAPGGSDTHFAVFRGSRSRVEVRQRREQNFRPELYVVPSAAADLAEVGRALRAKVGALQDRFPGVAVAKAGGEQWVTIPDRYRVGHEAHFAEVTHEFLHYLREPGTLPAWEKPNMLAKYLVTTRGVEGAQSV